MTMYNIEQNCSNLIEYTTRTPQGRMFAFQDQETMFVLIHVIMKCKRHGRLFDGTNLLDKCLTGRRDHGQRLTRVNEYNMP